MSKDKKKTESAFEEEGLFDDKLAACCGRCCCAPPPFRVALLPTIFLLIVFVLIWVLFFWDLTGLCAADTSKPPPCNPNNTITDPITNVTRQVKCPADDHVCVYLTVAEVPVAIWGLFLWVIIAGWAVLRAIVSIVWWIFRALSGRNGAIWAFVKPIDWAVHILIWDAFFFVCYNRWVFSATPLVYTVCRAITVISTIVAVIYILASVIATFIVRRLTASARSKANAFKAKAKLLDKLIKNEKASIADTLTLGLNKMAKKTAKNVKATADAAKEGDDVVVEMKSGPQKMDEKILKEAWARIDAGKKGFVNKDQVADAAGVKGRDAKDLWALFSPEKEGNIYYSEFAMGVRELERGLTATVNEVENRMFLGSIIRVTIMIILWSLGWTIALEAIELNISTLVSAIALLTVAFSMAMGGLFGRFLNAFVFLMVSHPYYKNDLVVAGGETFYVRKITLLNTFGFTPEGKWVMIDNAANAAGKTINLSRSEDCVFVYENAVHVDTPKKTLESWKATVAAYIRSKPEHFRKFDFNITSVNGGNALTVEMRVYLRGATWSQAELYNPIRAGLWIAVHQSAIQLGIYAAPKSPETELIDIVDADKAEAELVEKEDSGEERKEKKKDKKKDKEAKKDK